MEHHFQSRIIRCASQSKVNEIMKTAEEDEDAIRAMVFQCSTDEEEQILNQSSASHKV